MLLRSRTAAPLKRRRVREESWEKRDDGEGCALQRIEKGIASTVGLQITATAARHSRVQRSSA